MDPLGLGAIAGKFAAGGGGGKGLGDVLPSHDQAEAGRLGLSGNLPEEYEAIRVGRYKLIEGIPGRGDWYGEDPSAAWGQGRNDVHGKQTTALVSADSEPTGSVLVRTAAEQKLLMLLLSD